MLEAVTNTLGTVADTLLIMLGTFWFWLGSPGWNPLSWTPLTWMVAGLCALMLALMFRSWFDPAPSKAQPRLSLKPDLLISKGSIRQLENSSLQQLNFSISNMGATPVQLLELIVQTSLSRPIAVEAIELLLPQELMELEAVLPTELLGDGGTLQVFAYVSQRKSKLYNLRAKLLKEAQEKRFKVSPTGQTLQLARKVNRERLSMLRQQIWEAQNPFLKNETPPPELAPQPEPFIDPKKTQSTVKVKKTLDLDFPSKF